MSHQFRSVVLVGFFFQPSAITMIVILLGFLMIAFKRKRTGARLVAGGFALMVFSAFSPASLFLLSTLESRFSQPALETLVQAPTGVIVLGGAIDSHVSDERGIIAINERAERLTEGLVLLRRYPTATVVVQDERARELFVSMGIVPQRILLERHSSNTFENAKFSKLLVQPKSGQTWLLITSAYHMPRAVGSFRKVGFPVLPWPVDYRTTPSQSFTSIFYTPSDGLRLLDLAVKEYVGMFGYLITGRSSELFPSPT